MLRLSEPWPARTVDELDADPWLLNCQNGTLELPRDPAKPIRVKRYVRLDLITKILPIGYDPQASCPMWRAHLE